MPTRSSSHRTAGGRRWILALGLALLWPTTAPASAATAESDLVWIVEDQVVPEDLYAVGNEVRIAGRVEGDLLAVATDRVLVEGTVTGSVTVLASRVVIEGEVGGSVRGAAGEVTVNGRVGGDVVVGAFGLAVEGMVGRDVLAAAWSAAAAGSVGRDLRGLFRSLDLGGRVGGDVEIRADGLEAGRDVSVLGDVDYQAAHLSGEEFLEAGVEGSLINRGMLPPNIRIRGFRLMTLLFVSLVVLAAGLVIVRVLGRRAEAAVGRVITAPLLSLGKGLILFLSPLLGLVVAGVVVMSLPLYIWGPLLLVAAPFGAVGAGVWLLAVLVSHVPVAVATGRGLGRMLGRRWDLTPAYLVGAAVLLAALQIPALGGLAAAVVTGLGAGAWLGGKGRTSGTATKPEGEMGSHSPGIARGADPPGHRL